jgi:hypothetical protein
VPEIVCPSCGSAALDLVEVLPDERRRIRCSACGNEWLRGDPKRVYKTTSTIDDLRRRFPAPADVRPENIQRAEALKAQFLQARPEGRWSTSAFRERYQRLFSKAGLAAAIPQDLKYFANANKGANPGNMSVFNEEWNRLGPDEAANRVRESIEYLLYPPDDSYIEDRLTNLIVGQRGLGMKGFREALLTKVLCMVEPHRFLSILKYTGNKGKREVAKWVYDLDLPDPGAVSWTIGRLIFWSNDLLRELVGPGFQDMEHAAEFLWWAKDKERKALPK